MQAQAEFDIGDKWTYRVHNKGDRKDTYIYTHQAFKSEGGSGWYFQETQEPNARRKQSVWRYDYKRADRMEGFDFNPQSSSFSGNRFSNRQPSDDVIQLPLSIGKKYAVKSDWDNGEGFTKYDAEVVAFEKIKTEAGEFEAYRIKLAGWWTNTSRNITGRESVSIHFAPAIKKFVKWDRSSRTPNGSPWDDVEMELVKWEPKAQLPADMTVPKLAAQ